MNGFLKKLNKKTVFIISLCIVCLAVFAVNGIYAYLISKTETHSNTIVPATVSCTVEENFENGIKQDVKVRNTGNVNAFIRAAVVATFVSQEGKVLSTAPQENVDYNITFNTQDWKKGSDGFWYHSEAVVPDGVTSVLIQSATAQSAPDGYKLNIQIIATSIQSDPQTAVQSAWGVNVDNGKISPN